MNPLAAQLLENLGTRSASSQLEIGGGIALWHYAPYRETNDVDLWWKVPSEDARDAINSAATQVAGEHGLTLAHRAQTGYESWDLKRQNKSVFAVQIARKLDRVEPPLVSRWGNLLIESLGENVSNKMAALVGRGAPRDLLDIATLVRSGQVEPSECWRLWAAKPQRVSLAAARSAVLGHLESLEGRRPLGSIVDDAARGEAELVRRVIRELCHGD